MLELESSKPVLDFGGKKYKDMAGKDSKDMAGKDSKDMAGKTKDMAGERCRWREMRLKFARAERKHALHRTFRRPVKTNPTTLVYIGIYTISLNIHLE
mgnify:CR=1 FL=1